MINLLNRYVMIIIVCDVASLRDFRNKLVNLALSGSLCPALGALSVVQRAVGGPRSTISGGNDI